MKSILSAAQLKWKEPVQVDLPKELTSMPDLPDIVLQILQRQRVKTAAQARAFMDHRLYTPASSYELPDMGKSVQRILRALKDRELIGVWGDFDVDGQTSTAVLVSALRQAGARVVYHIPVRGPESHGIRLEVLQEFVKAGITLIITCDTGISEVASVAWAQHHGIDVILTDHHTLPEKIPAAFAVVNPQFLAVDHPLRPLPGVGVAYKLAEALFAETHQPDASAALYDLASLGIVADIAELRDDCRFLTQSGIELIRASKRASIRSILEAAEINPSQFSEESIAFGIAPRMNALGRLDDANPMVEFLLSDDPALLAVTTNRLEGLNATRKLKCDQVFQGALDQIKRNPTLLDHPVLMLSHPGWPAGVVGIVASRLVSLYHRPVILFVAQPGTSMKGSARSIEGIDITAAIRRQSMLLNSFGGHPMAAGLSLDPEHFKQFQRDLDRSVEQQLVDHPLTGELQIDAFQQPSSINLDLLQSIDRLAPFGAGNPSPVFAAKEVRLVSSTPLGKTREHLQLIVQDRSGETTRFTWWQGAGLPQPEGVFDLAYNARCSNYKGQPQVELEWLDFRTNEIGSVDLSTVKGGVENVDCRSRVDRTNLCREIVAHQEVVIYREGSDLSTSGKLRDELAACPSLIIWSLPPSQSVLDQIIKTVNPAKIYWLINLPPADESAWILKSAAQRIKKALADNAGRVDIEDTAAALSVTRQVSILLLRWFAARGDIAILEETDAACLLKSGGVMDKEQTALVQKQLKTALDEIQAYKRFLLRCDLDSLTRKG